MVYVCSTKVWTDFMQEILPTRTQYREGNVFSYVCNSVHVEIGSLSHDALGSWTMMQQDRASPTREAQPLPKKDQLERIGETDRITDSNHPTSPPPQSANYSLMKGQIGRGILTSWRLSCSNAFFELRVIVMIPEYDFHKPECKRFQLFSFRREIICDVLTQTGWRKFLSNFLSSPKRMLDVNTKSSQSPPPYRNGNLRLGLRFESLKLTFESWPPTLPPPPQVGLWDLSRFGLSIKSWKFCCHPPAHLTHPQKWDFSEIESLTLGG